MVPTINASCFFSVLVNTSGVAKTFSFLPPHGATLQPGEPYTVWGNVTTAFGSGTPADKRKHQALLRAMGRGDITIVSEPAPILQDTVTGAVKQLKLTSGTLGITTPCYDVSDPGNSDVSDVPPG